MRQVLEKRAGDRTGVAEDESDGIYHDFILAESKGDFNASQGQQRSDRLGL